MFNIKIMPKALELIIVKLSPNINNEHLRNAKKEDTSFSKKRKKELFEL